jgi:hypothetical protein
VANRVVVAIVAACAALGLGGALSVAGAPYEPVTPGQARLLGESVFVDVDVRDDSGDAHDEFAYGTTFHPSATVTGFSGTPTGTVRFRLFGNLNCSGTPSTVSDPYALHAGFADATDFRFTGARGEFSFRATYSGDGTYPARAECKGFYVVRAKPTVTTQVRNDAGKTITSVLIGHYAHPFVEVKASSGFTVDGTVTIRYYGDASCSSLMATSAQKTLVDGKVDAAAFKFTANQPVARAFRATYNGSTNYASNTGACTSFRVKALPTVATEVQDSAGHPLLTVQYGSAAFAHVVVGGAYGTPTGSVVVRLYANSSCTDIPLTTSPVALTNGTASVSPLGSHMAPGSYAYRATYGGDTNYVGRIGACESFVMPKVVPVLSATIEDPSGSTVASVPVGTIVHVHTVVTGAHGIPSGTVSAVILSPGCQGLGASGSATLSGGEADITSRTATATTAGTNVAFSVGYAGDAIYTAAGPVCVEVAVTAASSTPAPGRTPTVTPAPPSTASPSGSLAASALPTAAPSPSTVMASEAPTNGSVATAATSPEASAAAISPSESSGAGSNLVLLLLGLLIVVAAGIWFASTRRRRRRPAA